ncbi:AMP dependent [Cordyceps militaris]|uniref:AMP dependent n=1 Tax=Cordyceps militaris TaxID=73501 RepID=A0A2H4SVG5_CORMI|nr:AMP dependent [Cordyceps militaris]
MQAIDAPPAISTTIRTVVSSLPKESLSELDGGPPRPLSGSSAWSLLQRGVDLNPNGPALVVAHQQADHLKGLVGPSAPSADCLTWSYMQLMRGAARLGAVFERHQVLPRSTVLHLIPNCSEWALLVWVAALKCYTTAGLPQTLLEPASEAELRRCLTILAPLCIVVESEDEAARVDELRDQSQEPFLGLCMGQLTTPRRGWLSFVSIAEESWAGDEDGMEASQVSDSLERIVLTVFTSGTSGEPRCVQKSVRTLLAATMTQSRTANDKKPINIPATAVISSNTMTLAHGMIYLCWHNAGTMVLPSGEFSAEAILHAIEKHRISLVGYHPWAIRAIVKHPEFSQEKIKFLRHVVITGTLTTTAELAELQQAIPGGLVYPMWGMSEATGVLGWSVYPKAAPTYLGVPSCGTAMPGARIRVVDEDGRVVRRGRAGELHISGDVVFDNYVGTVPQPDQLYEDEGGRWLRTGDAAVLDDAGHVYVLGRVQDAIKCAGSSLYPATMEDTLIKHFNEEVRVTGVPSADGGEQPYAVFETTDVAKDVAASDVNSLVRAIGPDYRIDGVVCLEQLGMRKFPETSVKKLARLELKRTVTAYVKSQRT